MKDVQKKSGVGAIDFFCIGFGAIVGVGWAVSINNWMAGSGGPLPAAAGYIAAIIMMVPIALCYCELCAMLPVSGGGMAYAFRAYGDHVSFVSGWAAFGAFITIIPWEAIYVVDILSVLIPQLRAGKPLYTLAGADVYPSHIIIGTVISIVLYLINRKGVASSAKLQKFLCLALVGAGILAMICAGIKMDVNNFEPLYVHPKGAFHSNFFGGMLSILASAPFFLAGFETIPQGIESAGGDMKKIGKTVVFTVVLSCVFYALLLVTIGGAYPWQDFIGFNRPSAANLFKVIYKGPVGVALYTLILAGAICGLLTTWNGFMMASSQILMAMSRVSIVPNVLAKQHPKYKTPVNALRVCLVASLIGPFLGMGLIDSLTTFSAAGYVLSWTITAFCLIKLRKTEPELERPYKIPGGVTTAWVAGIIMLVVFVLLFIPGQPVYMGYKAIILFAWWMLIGVILFVLDYRQRQKYSKLKRASFLFASMASSSLAVPGFVDEMEDNYRVISFVIPKDTDYAGQTLMELEWGKTQSIFIVKIERGTEMMMLPNGNTKVLEGDRVFAMGLEKMVRRFSVRWDIGGKYTMSTMKDFMGFGSTEKQSPLACMELKVKGDEPYVGKPLKFSGIQSEAHCMLIGIERDGDFVMMPDANMEIRVEDVLWVVGTDADLKYLAEMGEKNKENTEEN